MVFLGSKAATGDMLSAWHLAEIRQEGMEKNFFFFYYFSLSKMLLNGTVLHYSLVGDDCCISNNTPFQDGWEQEWNNWVLVDVPRGLLGCVWCVWFYY